MDRRGWVRSRQRRVGRMAIAATRAMIATGHRGGVHAGRIGLDGLDRVNARRCRLAGAMARPASFSLAVFVNRRGWLIRRRHVMQIAMATRTCGKFHARRALESFPAMHAHGLFGGHLGMTFRTVHRIEPAPVPAFGADVAVETFRRAVNGALEVSEIDLVTIVTRVCHLRVCGLQYERRASEENGERGEECAHENALRVGFCWYSLVPSNYEPSPDKSQYPAAALNTHSGAAYTWSNIPVGLVIGIILGIADPPG